MYIIILHDTETEEIVGYVAPTSFDLSFEDFSNIMWHSWRKFQQVLEDGYTIEDFVEWHNTEGNSPVQIDWVLNDFIQL